MGELVQSASMSTGQSRETPLPKREHEEVSGDVTFDLGSIDNQLEPCGDYYQQENGFSVYKRVFYVASIGDRALYFCGIFFSLASGSVLPLMTLIFGNFVTIFTDFSTGSISSDSFRAEINHYTLYFVYLFIAKLASSYLSMTIFSIVSTRVTSTLRLSYLRSLLDKSISFHETVSSSGNVSLALSSHCNTIQSGLADKFGLSLQSISTVVTAFIVSFATQWKLTLVTATIIPATVIGVAITAYFDSKLEDSLIATNSSAATLAEEILGSMKTVVALRAQDRLLAKYKKILDTAILIGKKRAPIIGVQVSIYMFMIYAAYALAFWYGFHLYAHGEASTAGKVATTLFAVLIGTNAFAQLAAYLGSFLRIRAAGLELFRVIDRESSNSCAPVKCIGSSEISSVEPDLPTGMIQFNNVTFNYPLRPTVKVLKDLSFVIEEGKMTALVGPSGAGKSTIVGLLERWYDIQHGTVTFNGLNIKDIPIESFRRSIGLVQQDPVLFSTTIRQNVLYGLTENQLIKRNEAEALSLVERACKIADVHDFISKLPQGYDTHVGSNGILLSGGQKQRIAIARAIVGNPSVLILDEATSALDAATERSVQQALKRASEGRTTVAIAHRLSTIRHAHKIVVMKNGEIVEQGSHEDLMTRTDGTYRKLLAAQSLLQNKEELDHEGERNISDTEESAAQMEETSSPSTKKVEILDSTAKPPLNSVLRTVFQALKTQKDHWLAYSILFVCCIVGGAMYPLQAFFYAEVMETFTFTGSKLLSRSDFWSLMFFITGIAIGVAYFFIGGLGAFIGEAVSQTQRFAYITSMTRLSIAFFDDPRNCPGALTSKISTDPEAVKSIAGPNLGVMVVVFVSMVSTVAMSLAIGWKLALVAIFGAMPLVFGAGFVREAMEHKFEDTVSEIFSESVGYASECVRAIRTVKAFNLEKRVLKAFFEILNMHSTKSINHSRKSMVWFALSESIELLCMALTFWYGGQLLASHEYSTQQFFLVFVAIVLGSQSSGQFFAHTLDISKGSKAWTTIQSLQTDEIPDKPTNTTINRVKERSEETLLFEFKDASFAYPTRKSQPVLKSVNLKIFAGQFIALVGPTGCGKSTILSLLERFYELDEGQLLFDGINVEDIPTDLIRKSSSIVNQEPILYQGTIRENILLGTDAQLLDLELDHVAQRAQIYDFIQSLPDGYETKVGQNGTALSGGQKQRLTIARAIAQDSKVLLLDEATSALDSESEALILQAIRDLSKSKTIIAVAHRLSTIRSADQIYVLNQGTIVEHGDHAKLISNSNGFYSQMISLLQDT